jgi:hypothetical protein
MTKPARLTNRTSQKKPETNSSGRLRIFYILTLVVMILSLFLRVSGAKPGSARQATGGSTARLLVFHQEDGRSCEDLVIPATWNAVLSNCGSAEKQYTLNSTERLQIQKWIDRYGPVNYDNQTQTASVTTRLYLNGRGSQQANDAETQQMLDFAKTLTARLAAP